MSAYRQQAGCRAVAGGRRFVACPRRGSSSAACEDVLRNLRKGRNEESPTQPLDSLLLYPKHRLKRTAGASAFLSSGILPEPVCHLPICPSFRYYIVANFGNYHTDETSISWRGPHLRQLHASRGCAKARAWLQSPGAYPAFSGLTMW